MMKSALLFFAVVLFSFTDTFSQTTTLSSGENDLAKIYSVLLNHKDSADFYSEKFGLAFNHFITANPSTLEYSFRQLTDSNFCYVSTSTDGKFRIYSWDTETGGTMHFFKQLYQWKENGKVFTKEPVYEEGDAGNFCSRIYSVAIKGKTFYLVISNGIYSTKDVAQSISAFTIDKNKLTDTVRLFRTKSKKLNRIDVAFDFFSVVDRPERPLQLITYDDKNKIVYIPVVADKGIVTDRNILYQLKGDYFQFIGIETGKWK